MLYITIKEHIGLVIRLHTFINRSILDANSRIEWRATGPKYIVPVKGILIRNPEYDPLFAKKKHKLIPPIADREIRKRLVSLGYCARSGESYLVR